MTPEEMQEYWSHMHDPAGHALREAMARAAFPPPPPDFGHLILTELEKGQVLAALDTLGQALAGHKHQWTNEEKRAYEKAIRIVKR